MKKKQLALSKVYALLEPGPVVLLSTHFKGVEDVMTMSWHLMLDFEPPLIGCVVSDRDYSFELLRGSKECVINIPTVEQSDMVVKCGNTTGKKINKFEKFKILTSPASKVKAPLIDECFANLECVVLDMKLVNKYNFFILKVVKAWINPGSMKEKNPATLHHRGHGHFMVAGELLKLPSKAK